MKNNGRWVFDSELDVMASDVWEQLSNCSLCECDLVDQLEAKNVVIIE